ncbi:hypothetical protein LCGC14_2670860 [marine sediment metagenome]|uniref:Uncharacterized protein n=1 Tax=marine sediment metagenome TaxID=412755 RepID=A0A0F9ABK1_9ZZZZ
MNPSVPDKLRDALSQFDAIDWRFVDNNGDRKSMAREWDATLAHITNHPAYGQLSDADELYERSRWLRSRLILQHVDKLRELADLAFRFFFELTQAGGQYLLGERAGLSPLRSSQQPHSEVRFAPKYPPDPPPLDIGTYEQVVGGPHVLGARLIWWLAAANAPTDFGYRKDFSPTIWFQPIWVAEDGWNTRSNPHPLTLMKQAASKVCRLLDKAPDSVATAPKKCETPENGPQEPNVFWWNGQSVTLQKTPWLLLKCVWDRPRHVVAGESVAHVEELTALDEVWGGAHKKESTLSGTVKRVNEQLGNFPLTLRRKSGFFVLDIHKS